MLVSDESPVEGCNCLACVMARGRTVKGSKYVAVDNCEIPVPIDWTYLRNQYSTPYSAASEESVPTPPYEYKSMGKDFSGIYRFNYSTVDISGFGSTHSIVLEVLQSMTPTETFRNFIDLGCSGICYHLIEYFLVRWENGEYVRV